MANITLSTRLVIRNDTAANWASANPVLLKGEMAFETDTRKFKFGDGASNYTSLEYASSSAAVVAEVAPTASDKSHDEGTVWVNTDTAKAYIYYGVDGEDKAVWKQILQPEDLSGLGDMLKSEYATNAKASSGYVDKAIMSDTATTAEQATKAGKLANAVTISLSGDATGSVSFDGSANVEIASTLATSGVTPGTYSKVTVDGKGRVTAGDSVTTEDIADGSDTLATTLNTLKGKQDAITGAATTVVSADLTVSKVLVSDASGKIAAGSVSVETLEGFDSRISTIAGQVDNIPRYNYLTGVSVSIADGSEQTAIDTAAIAQISATHDDPAKWDACVVAVTFTPSDNIKDAVYYYNGESWVFLYYVSTGINRANGTTAGIVENSDDVTFTDGQATVVQAGKVKNALTIGSKTFDGSAAVSVESSDLSDLIPVATAAKVGGIKSSSDINTVSVDASGIATLNSVAVAKLALNGDTLILDCGTSANI